MWETTGLTQNNKNSGRSGKQIIGLTGGIGAGKSRILDILKSEYNAAVIQADLVAKELEEPGMPGYVSLCRELGTGFLKEDQTIDAQRLAQMIFDDQKILEAVNSIIHPLVWQEIHTRAAGSSEALVVVEAALFTENEDDFFDEIWYVYTLKEIRIQRLMQTRGYTREKCEAVMENQPSEELFCRIADRVIDNSGSMDQAREQIAAVMAEIKYD